MSTLARPAAFAAMALLTAASVSAASSVATVDATNGKVLVNRATVYTPATKGMALQVGDRVVVLDGGSASLRFSGDCSRLLDKTSVYTVGAESPCAPLASDRGLRSPVKATPAGAAGASAGAGAGATAATYASWGLIALAAVTPIAILQNSNHSSPVSQ